MLLSVSIGCVRLLFADGAMRARDNLSRREWKVVTDPYGGIAGVFPFCDILVGFMFLYGVGGVIIGVHDLL